MHIITSLPIDSEIPDRDVLIHIRKRLRNAELITLPKFSFMMFDSLLSIGDKLEKLEVQMDKIYYLFINLIIKQKKEVQNGTHSNKHSNSNNNVKNNLQSSAGGFGKTYEECENDLVHKLKTFNWIYEMGNIENVYGIIEAKVGKEEAVLSERMKVLKELIDEQRRMKNEKVKKKKIVTKVKNTNGIQNNTKSGQNVQLVRTTIRGDKSNEDIKFSKTQSSDDLHKNDNKSQSINQETKSTISSETCQDNQMDIKAVCMKKVDENYKKIVEKNLKELNADNITENFDSELMQNRFICNEGESLLNLEIYTETHKLIRQHYFIANDKQDVDKILKEVPEACLETLQLHLKTKHERLYSVFALESQTDEIINKLSTLFTYKDTITKEEYAEKLDKICKNDSLITITKNNFDLYLGTNYTEVLNIFLHVKFFRVYIESILHYGIGDVKFFVIDNKISEWRKMIREWRFSRRLCKDLSYGDIFPHTFVGKNQDENDHE